MFDKESGIWYHVFNQKFVKRWIRHDEASDQFRGNPTLSREIRCRNFRQNTRIYRQSTTIFK